MDVYNLLRDIKNLNDYIYATEDACSDLRNMKLLLNMSTILDLKKIRSLEIEYFNFRNCNGAAFIIIENMLKLPPSKTWGLLGKDLISLLQYWLEVLRQQLIKSSKYWWIFLNCLLKFIKILRQKDQALPDIIVEGLAESLLDLATSDHPDILQRQEILASLNLCCAESSRDIRFALRHHLDCYL